MVAELKEIDEENADLLANLTTLGTIGTKIEEANVEIMALLVPTGVDSDGKTQYALKPGVTMEDYAPVAEKHSALIAEDAAVREQLPPEEVVTTVLAERKKTVDAIKNAGEKQDAAFTTQDTVFATLKTDPTTKQRADLDAMQDAAYKAAVRATEAKNRAAEGLFLENVGPGAHGAAQK